MSANSTKVKVHEQGGLVKKPSAEEEEISLTLPLEKTAIFQLHIQIYDLKKVVYSNLSTHHQKIFGSLIKQNFQQIFVMLSSDIKAEREQRKLKTQFPDPNTLLKLKQEILFMRGLTGFHQIETLFIDIRRVGNSFSEDGKYENFIVDVASRLNSNDKKIQAKSLLQLFLCVESHSFEVWCGLEEIIRNDEDSNAEYSDVLRSTIECGRKSNQDVSMYEFIWHERCGEPTSAAHATTVAYYKNRWEIKRRFSQAHISCIPEAAEIIVGLEKSLIPSPATLTYTVGEYPVTVKFIPNPFVKLSRRPSSTEICGGNLINVQLDYPRAFSFRNNWLCL